MKAAGVPQNFRRMPSHWHPVDPFPDHTSVLFKQQQIQYMAKSESKMVWVGRDDTRNLKM